MQWVRTVSSGKGRFPIPWFLFYSTSRRSGSCLICLEIDFWYPYVRTASTQYAYQVCEKIPVPGTRSYLNYKLVKSNIEAHGLLGIEQGPPLSISLTAYSSWIASPAEPNAASRSFQKQDLSYFCAFFYPVVKKR
jgi:hypothetical protein